MDTLSRSVLALLLILSTSWSLAQESASEEPAAEPAAAEAEPAPAEAEQVAGDPELGPLMENVVAIADQLQTDIAALEENIQASRDSAEAGAEVLDAMLASVDKVHSSMAEESQVWSELEGLLERWEENRRNALERSETNPAFTDIAEQWQTRIERARDLQDQIITQRANSLALRRSIEDDREVVLAYYELGQADQAIAGLQRVSESLQSLNDNMQTIVETVNTVSAPAISN